MRRYLFGIMVALLATLAVPVASAGATPPSDVSIEANTLFAGTGVFAASGPAVDDGVFCASGDTSDEFGKVSGLGKWGFNIQLVKKFTCDDESGSFLVKLQTRVLFDGPVLSSFNWVVTGGDGAYSDLHGSGNGVGLPPNSGFDILDVYSGQMHID